MECHPPPENNDVDEEVPSTIMLLDDPSSVPCVDTGAATIGPSWPVIGAGDGGASWSVVVSADGGRASWSVGAGEDDGASCGGGKVSEHSG